MSHRTEELKPLTGVAHVIRELRYHEIARQGLAVVLILLYALTATPHAVWAGIGMVLAFVGVLVRLHASGYIMKNEELATNGPYALVRHPLYTGNILVIIGFSVANVSWWALPLAAVFFWFYYPTAIEYEDRKLKRYFGNEWESWAGATPALVPNFRNARRLFAGQWSLTKSLRKNGEIIIAIYVLICMAIVITGLR